MKKANIIKTAVIITGVLIAILLLIFGLGKTYASSDTYTVYSFKLGVGESKNITVGRAYAWTNSNQSVVYLNANRGEQDAVVIGLKPGIATISAGTAVGQVISYEYIVVDRNGGGNGDNCECGSNCSEDCTCGCHDTGGGDPGGDGGTKPLEEIPGLSSSTQDDTVLSINGDKWIVIKNISYGGSKYAMLLKQTPISHKCFDMTDKSYEGSPLQQEFTTAYSKIHIPEILMKNAVIPNLGGETTTSVSLPSGQRAPYEEYQKDIIFPLSYKEAADWGGSTDSTKLYLSNGRWWLRTPNGNQWYYVKPYQDSPNKGSIISAVTLATDDNLLYLRPAIWVEYKQ